jgi:hypothetical protein
LILAGSAAAASSDLGHAQRERFRFIESTLLWEGSMRRQRVCEVFGISVNHVTKELRRYEESYPNNVLYDHRRQAYVPGPRFKPHFASRDPREYLGLQLARAETGSKVVAPLLAGWDTVPTHTVPNPPHGIGEAVLRPLVRAITEKSGVDVGYFSASGKGPSTRRLWPHALLHGGVRWYVRAYDAERREFRSFALQRMDHVKPSAQEAPVPAAQDLEWQQFVTLRVVPNPKLSAVQQQLVARDFGMVGPAGKAAWVVELRRCLIPYFASVYGLDRTERSPLRQRVVLQDVEAVRKWFFTAAEE